MIKDFFLSISLVFKVSKRFCSLKIIFEILSAVILPMSLIYIQRVVDGISGILNGSLSVYNFLPEVTVLIALLTASAFMTYLINRVNNAVSKELSMSISSGILEKFGKTEYGYFELPSYLDTLQMMRENPDREIHSVFNSSIDLISDVVKIIGVSLLFLSVNYLLVLFFLILISLIIFLDFLAMDKMNTMFNQQSVKERRMNDFGSLISSKKSLYELKIMNGIPLVRDKLRAVTDEVWKERVNTTMKSQIYSGISRILILLWFVGTLVFLIISMKNSVISMGVFVALASSLNVALSLSENLSFTFSSLVQNGRIIKHYNSFMKMPEENIGNNEAVSEKAADDYFIIFDNVSFKYPETDKMVLKNVSFKVKKDERIALVGANGSGKSTIIKLLLRLYHPESGRILLNGKNIENIGREGIHEYFSVVFQNFANYQLSVRENVALSRLEQLNDDDEIRKSMSAIGLETLTDKLDRPLGKLEDGGIGLSGGQWQRLAISRALFDESDFVLFDEPTAALDPVMESELYESLYSILDRRGCILISHRLGSTKIADRILVLDGGKIVEDGNHKKLMAKNGVYNKMYSSQSSWYTAKI